MRMRKKKHRDERIENCGELVVKTPFPKGEWKTVFGNGNKIHLEIGCGKGRFITETAKQNPEVNFIAIEKNLDVALLAMEKAYGETFVNQNIMIMLNASTCGHIYEYRDTNLNHNRGAKAQLWSIAGFANACIRGGLTELSPDEISIF